MTRRRLLPSSARAPVDDDDILLEILLRLPPLPSSLPRASLVCKRWRHLVSDPRFLRRFREHHRKPPILGFFSQWINVAFTSALGSPDTIPASRLSLRLDDPMKCEIADCRHGLVLFLHRGRRFFLVWDPVTGEQRRVDSPPSFRGEDRWVTNGAVVGAASERGHVHGGFRSGPFQIVLLGFNSERIFACIYSSETCAWGNAVSLLCLHNIRGVSSGCPNTLVGNSLFWFLYGKRCGILKFDLCKQSLAVIELPSGAVDYVALGRGDDHYLITPADGGGLSFLYLSGFSAQVWSAQVWNAQVWKWKANHDGGAGWILGTNVDLNNLHLLEAGVHARTRRILGMAEDDNTVFLLTDVGVFVLHLESMQFKKLSITMGDTFGFYYPFRSFYPAGT